MVFETGCLIFSNPQDFMRRWVFVSPIYEIHNGVASELSVTRCKDIWFGCRRMLKGVPDECGKDAALPENMLWKALMGRGPVCNTDTPLDMIEREELPALFVHEPSSDYWSIQTQVSLSFEIPT